MDQRKTLISTGEHLAAVLKLGDAYTVEEYLEAIDLARARGAGELYADRVLGSMSTRWRRCPDERRRRTACGHARRAERPTRCPPRCEDEGSSGRCGQELPRRRTSTIAGCRGLRGRRPHDRATARRRAASLPASRPELEAWLIEEAEQFAEMTSKQRDSRLRKLGAEIKEAEDALREARKLAAIGEIEAAFAGEAA